MAAIPSSLLALHALINARRLIRPMTAIMMTAARTGLGRWYSSEVKNSSVSSTQMAETTEEKALLALLSRFKAERENEPLTGMEWLKAAATLASP